MHQAFSERVLCDTFTTRLLGPTRLYLVLEGQTIGWSLGALLPVDVAPCESRLGSQWPIPAVACEAV